MNNLTRSDIDRLKTFRTFILLAAIVVSLVSLVGCSDDGGNNPGNSNNRNNNTNNDDQITSSGDGSDGVDAIETVVIGGKTWMKKNLNVVTDNSWCYSNSTKYCNLYGRLYSWPAANAACSSLGGGWRLADADDWDALVRVAGGPSIAGKHLKGQSGLFTCVPSDSENNWLCGEDTYGFSALPGGFCGLLASDIDHPVCQWIDYQGFWWSATEVDTTSAISRSMNFTSNNVNLNMSSKGRSLLSVRCVRDE